MTEADVETELRTQFMEAFEGAEYPVGDQMELVPALPQGPGTQFEAGDVSISAMELAMTIGDHQAFPYDSPEALVDDIIEGMQAEGLL